MLRRVARDLFWVGRYLERADCLARFLFVQRRLALEVGRLAGDRDAWGRRVLSVLGDGDLFSASHRSAPEIDDYVAFAVLSPAAPNSIAGCVTRARENARSGRAYLSRETYESVNRLYLMLQGTAASREEWSFALQRIEQACRVVSGFLADTVVRDEAWQVINLGRHLERASQTIRIVQAEAVGGEGGPWGRGAPVDPIAWGGILRSCNAYEAYRRVFKGPIEPENVLELLLLYPAFPRSLRASLALARENLLALGLTQETAWRPTALDTTFNSLFASVTYSGVNSIVLEGVVAFLARLQRELAGVGIALEDFFEGTDAAPGHPEATRPSESAQQ